MKQLIKIMSLLFGLVLICCLTNCDNEFQKDEMKFEGKAEVVLDELTGTNAVISIKLKGILSQSAGIGNENKDNFRLYYGTVSNPLEMKDFARPQTLSDGSLTGHLGFKLPDLQPATKYYIALKFDTIFTHSVTLQCPNPMNVAATATTGFIIPEGFSSFTTLNTDFKVVDLGLSVLWAETDLGSDEYWYTPTYTWCTSNISGLPPVLDIAGTEYDPVTAALGEGWRMPTAAEYKELIENTSVTHREDKEYGGFLLCRNLSNGKYIRFYPHVGGLTENWEGIRWTSDVYEASSKGFDVKVFSFSATDATIKKTSYSIYTKYPIRPVHVK